MILNTDGGARGNPGPGAIGAIIKNDKGEIIFELGKYLGVCTNNEAEYKALEAGLESALERKITEIKCNLDSELVVKQLKGEYKVKNDRLKILFKRIKDLESKFEKISYHHIPRSKNSQADALVNKVLDEMNNE